MDPLSALSFAVNIVEVVQAAKKLLSSTRQISKLDAREEHAELECLTKELEGWVLRVTPPLPPAGQPISWSPEEQSLHSLGTQCQKIITELLRVLNTLKAQCREGTLRRRIESFYKALLGLWEEDKVRDLWKRLDTIATSIQRQLDTFNSREIMKKLNELDRHRFQYLKELRGASRISSRDAKMDFLRKAAAAGSRCSAEMMVLEQLHFDAMDHRQRSIAPRYGGTLSWLYGTNDEPSPARFNDWLTSDEEDLYWISGKPGSGKSTLMVGSRPSSQPQTEPP